MDYIKGKIRNIIYQNDNGFLIAIFRILETNCDDLNEFVLKTITVTGNIFDMNQEDTFILTGKYVEHDRYGYQFTFQTYERIVPTTKDAIIDFLTSPLVKNCAQKTAEKIVETLGTDAIQLIKENKNNLLLIPGMTEKRANNIYVSIIEHSATDDLIIELKELGFSISEATRIIKKYNGKVKDYLEENLYYFVEVVDFDKLDRIYQRNYDAYDMKRQRACFIESLKRLSMQNGDMYHYEDEVRSYLQQNFQLFLEDSDYEFLITELIDRYQVSKVDDRLYLYDNLKMENEIAEDLKMISILPNKKTTKLDERIEALEHSLDVTYNLEQKKAIQNALENRITIISGGPGTGKTTIVNAIVQLYITNYNLRPIEAANYIALLAPTGRASKKLCLSTGKSASTIHRYLKWNKNTNEFLINEDSKQPHKLVIIDEMSMIDTHLFYSLLKGLSHDIQLVLVGDIFQLPSVGPGTVLKDIVESEQFSYCPLETIYRQSSNSYIPYLAKEIKEHEISEEIDERKDDFNFLHCSSNSIKEYISQICLKSKEKGLNIDEFQILAPMYKGENGIDNLNILMQNLFNPKTSQKEIKIGDVLYRVNDKVIQLVNNPDCNIYNGDIGYIVDINLKSKTQKKDEVTVDFDGNYVILERDDLLNIKHAYAITIHKAQGSEFNHVILPITKNYHKMLYNKLIYTGVSRAKKSLTIVGDIRAFHLAVNNDYSTNRKTTLKDILVYKFEN